MTTDEAMTWWYGRIDFERRTPHASDLKLDQMRALLRCVDEPQRRLRILHVAGSKGKGSTSAMLASILQAAGYRVGLFTSPHLSRVEERIQVDGNSISTPELLSLLAEIHDRVGSKLNPTFFEVGTAAGFLHFVRRRVDFAVIEVGLGGRFDSTNVCDPLLSIITSISFDHTKILGDTLARIAFEKSGILKPGRPAVSGVTDNEAQSVIERIAKERPCPLTQLGRDVHFVYAAGRVDITPPRVSIRTLRRTWPTMKLALLGFHQAANAALVVAAVEQLQDVGLTIRDTHVAEGLANVQWPARLEVLGRKPLVVLDCAHNTASVQAMLDALAESFPPGRRLLIFAASADKDIPGMLRLLAPHFERFLFTRFGTNQRAVAPEQLAQWLKEIRDVPVELHETSIDAWRSARTQAGEEDQIIVTGSVFLAGELRPTMTSAS